MIEFDYSNQSNTIHSDKWEIDGMQAIISAEYNNEYSTIKNNTDINNLFKNVDSTSESEIECSDNGLSDNQVFTTRLENNQNNVIRLRDNLSSLSLECNNEFDTGRCYTFAFFQIKEENIMKIDINPEAAKWLRKMGKMDETPSDVIIRIFSQVYACELCCNLE